MTSTDEQLSKLSEFARSVGMTAEAFEQRMNALADAAYAAADPAPDHPMLGFSALALALCANARQHNLPLETVITMMRGIWQAKLERRPA